MTGCYGQDWAGYQSSAPSVTGLSFVFLKATEGLTYVNPRYTSQLNYARQHRLVIGHYHYPHMGQDPVAEAKRFLDVIDRLPGEMLCLDWEGYDKANKGVPRSTQIAYKDAFLAHLAHTVPTAQSGTYANKQYLGYDPTGPYGDFLWIATADLPAGKPGITHPWLFHQYGASGVDKDYCTLSAAALRVFTNAKEADMPLTNADAQKLWSYSHDDKPDVHATLFNANANAAAAVKAVAALSAKIDKIQAPVIDYTALAKALLAEIKG